MAPFQLVLVTTFLGTASTASAPAASTSTADAPRFVDASGTTMYDVGVSIGRQQKEAIAQMFHIRADFYRHAAPKKAAAWAGYANASLKTIATHAPITLEEMRGVAHGAELPLTTLLQLATDYESGLWLYSKLPAGDAALQMPIKVTGGDKARAMKQKQVLQDPPTNSGGNPRPTPK